MDKFAFQARVYRFFWNSVDWLFPPECIGCGKEGVLICADCWHGMERASLNSCIYCGVQLPKRGVCARCEHLPHAIDELRYVAAYQDVMRTAIHRLKYERDLGVALELANMLAQIVQATNWQIDLIMPVPLSEKRKAQRGYNQAALLAYPLSLRLHLPENTKGLVRVHETRSPQNSLSSTRPLASPSLPFRSPASPSFPSGSLMAGKLRLMRGLLASADIR